jgi:hypothetical protein
MEGITNRRSSRLERRLARRFAEVREMWRYSRPFRVELASYVSLFAVLRRYCLVETGKGVEELFVGVGLVRNITPLVLVRLSYLHAPREEFARLFSDHVSDSHSRATWLSAANER